MKNSVMVNLNSTYISLELFDKLSEEAKALGVSFNELLLNKLSQNHKTQEEEERLENQVMAELRANLDVSGFTTSYTRMVVKDIIRQIRNS
jgi:CO dehydrogenase nickel-insertion accessory protein CooC1